MSRDSSKSLNVALEKIDVLDFLEELGLRNVEDKGTEIFYSCPFPGHNTEDSHPSASMSTDGSTKAYCFACGWRGNALRFLSDYEGVSPLMAARWIRQRFGDDFLEPEGTVLDEIDSILNQPTPNYMKNVQILDEVEIDRRAVYWFEVDKTYRYGTQDMVESVPEAFSYMLDRGFTPKTLEEYEIGYDYISDRITIPYRDINHQLLGFKARAVRDDQYPRYQVLGGIEYGFYTFRIGDYLWGLNSASEDSIQPLIVREGELNALMLRQYGYGKSVGVSGKRLSDAHLQSLRYFTRIAFWFDDFDDSVKAAEKCESWATVYVVYSENDPADMDEDGVAVALNGAQTLWDVRLPSE